MKVKYSDLVAWAMAHEQEWTKINGLVDKAKAKEDALVDMARNYLTDGFTIEAQGNSLIIGLPYASKHFIQVKLDGIDDVQEELHNRVMEYLAYVFLR